mgnify:CR=1 FL=1
MFSLKELQRLSTAFADLQARHHAQTLELERMGESYGAAAIRIAALEKQAQLIKTYPSARDRRDSRALTDGCLVCGSKL